MEIGMVKLIYNDENCWTETNYYPNKGNGKHFGGLKVQTEGLMQ